MIEVIKNLFGWSKESKLNKIILITLTCFTFFRIYLAIKTPLYAQAGADFDDYLFINYALNIISGRWLGPFTSKTLAKGASFAIFLVVTYILGIPYSTALILVYIFAILLFIIAIKRLIPNKYFLALSYLFLLYSPIMFHIENTQKIYRGGLIVATTLIVISAAIGLYTRRNSSRKLLIKWSLILGSSLSFFWFLKEDSIWILPFVFGAIIVTILSLLLNKNKKRQIFSKIVIVILPVIMLIISIFAYSYTNYKYYGEFTVTDRSGTYFKEVVWDLLQIEDNDNYQDIWITKKMMYKAVEVSPTLQSIKPQIDDMYKNSWALNDYGEIEGDMIYWIIKEKVEDAGIYNKGGKYVNSFYKKIDKELKNAYKTKKIKKSKNRVYLSSMSRGFTIKEIKKFNKRETKSAFNTIITYKENETGVYEATGSYNEILNMQYLTNSNIIFPGTGKKKLGPFNLIVNIDNKIVNFYQAIGFGMFISGLIGFVVLLLSTIYKFITKQKTNDNFSIILILFGLSISAFALFVGVEWFCSWFGFFKNRYIYNYTCGIFPIIQIFEMIGIYYIVDIVIKVLKQVHNKCLQKKYNNIK